MHHLHYEVNLNAGDAVEVTLDKAANVLLLDDPNYENYRSGKSYRYYGGYAEESPLVLDAPRPGRWHVVVDLGGYPGRVRAGVAVLAAERS